MPKYLIKAKYGDAAARQLQETGARELVNSLETMAQSLGGRLESYHFALGEADAYAILEYPDATAGTLAAVMTAASGMVDAQTTVLITADEMDAALARGRG